MSLPRSELNGFLFADVGIEPSGMPLSVLSTLARLGMDPWQEAARLAKLPRSAAVEALARLIAGMPASLWPLPDATAIAARLVALLPTGGDRSAVRAASSQPNQSMTPSERLTALLPRFGANAGANSGSNAGSPGTTQRWMLALALLAALLGGLFMNMHPNPANQPGTTPPSQMSSDVPGVPAAAKALPPLRSVDQ
jgi:hypothetical protein